jgi:hypothetical protein
LPRDKARTEAKGEFQNLDATEFRDTEMSEFMDKDQNAQHHNAGSDSYHA